MRDRAWYREAADLYAAGQTLAEVAARYGVSRQRVHQVLRGLGVQTRTRAEASGQRPRKPRPACAVCGKPTQLGRRYCSRACSGTGRTKPLPMWVEVAASLVAKGSGYMAAAVEARRRLRLPAPTRADAFALWVRMRRRGLRPSQTVRIRCRSCGRYADIPRTECIALGSRCLECARGAQEMAA